MKKYFVGIAVVLLLIASLGIRVAFTQLGPDLGVIGQVPGEVSSQDTIQRLASVVGRQAAAISDLNSRVAALEATVVSMQDSGAQ